MKTRKRIKLFGDYGILYLGSHEFLFDSEDYDLIRNRDWYRDNIQDEIERAVPQAVLDVLMKSAKG